MRKGLLSLLGVSVLSSVAYGGLAISTGNTPVVLGFDSSIPGVYRLAGTPTSGLVISEPTGWTMTGETGRPAFDSRSWHATTSSQAYNKFATPFTSDIDNNGQTDNRFDFFQENLVASPAGGAGDYAFRFDQDTWANKIHSLKVDNNTGSTVTDWTVTLDTWFRDTGKNAATLSIYYGTSWQDNLQDAAGPGSGFTLLGSRVGTKTNAGLSSLQNIGGSLNASVPAGGSLYLKFVYAQNGGGTEFIMDNISVTAAVPEPTSMALLGLAGVGLLSRRRHA